jgi:hypothetical protein
MRSLEEMETAGTRKGSRNIKRSKFLNAYLVCFGNAIYKAILETALDYARWKRAGSIKFLKFF